MKLDAFDEEVAAELAAWREEVAPGAVHRLAEIEEALAVLAEERAVLQAKLAITYRLSSEPFVRLYMRDNPTLSRRQAVWDVHLSMMGDTAASRRRLGPRPKE